MSPELVFVIWCVLAFEDLSCEYYIESPLASGFVPNLYDGTSNVSNQDRLYLGYGKKTQLVPSGHSYSSLPAEIRKYKVYYPSGVNVTQSQIEEYIEMTNLWLNLLRIGEVIEIEEIAERRVSELDQIEQDFTSNETVEDLILFTTKDISVTSSDLPIAYNLPNGDNNCIVVTLLPEDWINSSSFVFEPRVMAHEVIHNSNEIFHVSDCKSIMYHSLNPNMGFSNVDTIMGYQKLTAGSTFGYCNIEDFIYPKRTNEFCWSAPIEFGLMTSFEKGYQIRTTRTLERVLYMLDSISSYQNPISRDIMESREKMKFRNDSHEVSMDLYLGMVRNSQLYYRSFVEMRAIGALLKYNQKSGELDEVINRLKSSYHRKIFHEKRPKD